jgi:hypothetical protein
LFLSFFLSKYLMKVIFEKKGTTQHRKSYSKRFSSGEHVTKFFKRM